MYYTSKNKAELETYNELVSQSENYDGVTTVGWAKIIEHQNGEDFAILAHSKYTNEDLEQIDSLDSSWFPEELIE